MAKASKELSEQDRNRIGHARDVLKEYGLYTDVAEMSDVAYEKRNCRMKALELCVQSVGGRVQPGEIYVGRAALFFDFIWEGDTGVSVRA